MFTPDYTRIQKAARNIGSDIVPLYDHIVSPNIIAQIINNSEFPKLWNGDDKDLNQFFKIFNNFLKDMGYDAVMFEGCISEILPSGGALGGHVDPVIKTREDFEKYPFEEIKDKYFNVFDRQFTALSNQMPLGMKAIGGVGNGVFEIVQDLTGYMNLCIMLYDDPDLFNDLFRRVGDMMFEIWQEFLKKYSDTFCVLRFGDDLGFNTQTLLPHSCVKENIIPQYKRIVDLVHSTNKPFLLHSCGNLFDVMDDIITLTGIDAKHSNEDGIAPFQQWIDKYGDKIGNFGGIDTDIICRDDTAFIKQYTTDVCKKAVGKGGIAIGTGNSVPDYVSVAGYLAMNEAVREFRGL